MRDLTTSTGEPHTTAKKPAPRPERMWQYALSPTMPLASSDSLICGSSGFSDCFYT